MEDEIAQWLRKNEEKKFAYNDKYFYRGIYETATSYDIKFDRFQAKKLGFLDSYLKKFQYKRYFCLICQSFVGVHSEKEHDSVFGID